MDEKRGKQDLNTISITSELIMKISNQPEFSKITSLNFASKAGKIKTIENLAECINLQSLTLSYHFISKIENLDALTRLRELDLSENRISKLENFHRLSLLETLNLSGNSIKELPKSCLEPLKCLKTLKIAKNKISGLQELGNLSILPNLENLYVAGNPICESEDYKLYLVYYISSLESLDGDIVNSQLRQKATKKFAGPSPEVWVLRENLVSFRRNLAEKDQEKKEQGDKIASHEKKIEKTRAEINNIEKTLEKYTIELENIEKAMMNTPDSQDARKAYMRDLIEKTENLQKSSIEIQEKMSEARTTLHRKQETIDHLTRQLEEIKQLDRTKVVEEKEKLKLDIEELEDTIEEYEQEYALILENLNIATTEVTKLEEEVLKIRAATELQKRPGHKKDQSFTMDSDTKYLLTARKEEIIQQIPELKQRRQQLIKDLETLSSTLSIFMLEYRDVEREILDISRQISDCEEYLHKLNTPSPMRNRANTRLMWDSVKGLWQLLTDNPWEYETDDIQKGIIKWAEHMKEHITRYKLESETHEQASAQQRFDHANISHLNLKINELTEQLISKNKIAEENDKLHAKIDAFKEKEKKMAFEHSQLIERIRILESKNGQNIENEEESINVLRLEKESIKAQVKEIMQQGEKQEQESKARLVKLNKFIEERSNELHDLTQKCESQKEDYDQTLKELQEMNKKKTEVIKLLENLERDKQELEGKLGSIKELAKKVKPAKEPEEEKEEIVSIVKHLFTIFHIETLDFSNLKHLLRSLQEKHEKLQEDLQKVQKFKVNKQKFVEMYESNTKELQDEWDQLKKAKEQFEFEKAHIDGVKSEKKNLDDQMKQLVSTTKDLQRVKNNLEKEVVKTEEHLNSLKQSASTFEGLKQKEVHEYNRMQGLNEVEMRKIEESMQELRNLKTQTKELRNEKSELDSDLLSAKKETQRLEESKKVLEDEIKAMEGQIYKLNNKLTDEQVKAQKELEKVTGLQESRQKEFNIMEGNIKAYETQIIKLQEQLSLNAGKLSSLNEEISEKDSILREKKSCLREIESKYLTSESALDRSRKETEYLNQTFSSKTQKISALDSEMQHKSAELEKINIRHEQSNAELHLIQSQISRIKTDLLGIEQIITSKNNEYNIADSNLKMRINELKDIERQLNDKRNLLSKADQDYALIHNQAKTEEETIYILQEEGKSMQQKIAKLSEVLKRVESQKAAVLHEIEGINTKVREDELRHRKELENLRNAVSNGESTLRQVMESVQRCRNKLATDKEELAKLQDEISMAMQERETIERLNRELNIEGNRLRDTIKSIKEEEDTAIVLLALSGHKIDDRIKQRITSLCRSATELELLKASMQESAKEVRESISETRMRQNSRLESYDNLSMFEKESRAPQESHLDEYKAERTSFFRNM